MTMIDMIVVVVALVWLMVVNHTSSVVTPVPVDEAVTNVEYSLRFVMQSQRTIFYSEYRENLYEWTDLSRMEQSKYGKLSFSIFQQLTWLNSPKLNEFGVNRKANENVPNDRRAPDNRPSKCRHWHYDPRAMPNVSVIIPFHDEDPIVLTRTIFSVLLNSPRSLLKEIIIVADGQNLFADKAISHLESEIYSNKYYPNFLENLEIYRSFMSESCLDYLPLLFGEKIDRIRIFKTQERYGWSRSIRNIMHQVTGDVMVFLTSHTEVSANWLVPLIAPIVGNKHTITMPNIGHISEIDFHFSIEPQSTLYWNGGLDIDKVALDQSNDHIFVVEWSKNETIRTLPRQVDLLSQVYFAIDVEYALEIDLFDSDYVVNPNAGNIIWDYTYKLRKCGGRILRIPCSVIYQLKKPLAHHPMGEILDRTHQAFQYRYEPDCLLKQFANEFLDPSLLWQTFYVHHPMLKDFDCQSIPLFNIDAVICSGRPPPKARERITLKNDMIVMQTFRRQLSSPNVAYGQLANIEYAVCLAPEPKTTPNKYRSMVSCYCWEKPRARTFRLNGEGRLFYGNKCLIPKLDSKQIVMDDCQHKLSTSWHYNRKQQQLSTLSSKCLDYWPDQGLLFTQCEWNHNNNNKSSQLWHWIH